MTDNQTPAPTPPPAAGFDRPELVPDIPDFDGVELEALQSEDGGDGGLRCFLGSHASGIPSLVETILDNREPGGNLEDLLKDLADLLSQHLQAGHNNPHLPDAPLQDASRYYELQTAAWFLSALTGQTEGGLMLLTTFKVSVIDIAALRFLAHDKKMTVSEYLRAIIRGHFANRHTVGLEVTAQELRTTKNSAHDLALCDGDKPPVWRRLLKQIVGENDQALERNRQPGNLMRLLLWKNRRDRNLLPQTPLPVVVSPALQEQLIEELHAQQTGPEPG